MTTSMPFCKELAAAAGSSLFRDMMVVRFQREVTITLLDEAKLRKKAKEIMARVAERDFVIGKLELLIAFDSSLQSISLSNEVSMILVNVMKKQKRGAELLSFIEKLKSLAY